jgi:hypothetical protein
MFQKLLQYLVSMDDDELSEFRRQEYKNLSFIFGNQQKLILLFPNDKYWERRDFFLQQSPTIMAFLTTTEWVMLNAGEILVYPPNPSELYLILTKSKKNATGDEILRDLYMRLENPINILN